MPSECRVGRKLRTPREVKDQLEAEEAASRAVRSEGWWGEDFRAEPQPEMPSDPWAEG